MARETKTATITRADEADDADFTVIPTKGPQNKLTDADEALLDFWETSVSAGSEAYIVIMKIVQGQRNTQQMCDRVPVDKYDYYSLQVFIRDTWGAGDYRLLLMGPDPRKNGARGQLQNQLISIAAPASKSTELAVIPGQNGNDGGTVGVLLREVLQELRAVHTQPQKTLAEQVQEMATIATAMKTAFGGGEPKKSAMETAMEKMMEQMMLKNFERMFEGGDGETEKESGFGERLLGIIEGAAPLLMTAMANRQARPARPTRPAGVRPNPTPRQNPQPAPQPTQQPEKGEEIVINPETLTDQQKAVIKQYLGQALMAARMKLDPEPIASAAVTQNPDAVAELLAVPNLIDEALKIEPDMTPHRQWLDDLVEWCKGHMGIPCRFDEHFDDGEGGEEGEEVEEGEEADPDKTTE